MASLSQRIAVVTGGSGALGRAIVDRLSSEGANVFVFDLNSGREDLQQSDHFYRCDVTNPDNVDHAMKEVIGKFGRIDILVNNAGILGPVAPIVDVEVETWRRVIDVNLTGAFICCRAAAPHMQAARFGRIINISSVQGKEGMAHAGAYAASKAGLIALTKTLGKELATSGVLVNCVTPTAIDVGMFDEISEGRRADILARIPMNRFCSAHEVAAMVAWLAGDDCSFSTGAVFDLSGGRSSY